MNRSVMVVPKQRDRLKILFQKHQSVCTGRMEKKIVPTGKKVKEK